MTSKLLTAAAVSAALFAATASNAATNLLINAGADDALVGGEIPGWTEITGSNWTQRSSSPSPQSGSAYFFAGAGTLGVLQQIVDVSSFAAAIDAGTQSFDFSGYRRAFSQSNPDTSQFRFDFLDGSGSEISNILSDATAVTTEWVLYEETLLAPVNTRSISVNLISTRNNGTNNDGYFDTLSLSATPASAIPLPASALLLGGALGAVGFWGRRKGRT